MTDDTGQPSAFLSYVMQNLQLSSASSSNTPNQDLGIPVASTNVQSQDISQKNTGQRTTSYSLNSLFLTDYEQHAWLGQGQLQTQGISRTSDHASFRTSKVDLTTSTSACFQTNSPKTPDTSQSKTSCVSGSFMPWNKDTGKELLESCPFTDAHHSEEYEVAVSQDQHASITDSIQISALYDSNYSLFSPAPFQEYENTVISRAHQKASVLSTSHNRSFFSPSPSSSSYASTSAQFGTKESLAPLRIPEHLPTQVGAESGFYSNQTSTSTTNLRDQLQIAGQTLDSEIPTRFLKISNVDRRLSPWVAQDTFKDFGDLRGVFTSFLLSDGIIFLEYFDIRHAIIMAKRLYFIPTFKNMAIKVLFCSLSYIQQVLPERQISNNEGIIIVSLQAPILTENEFLQFLSTFGEIRIFQKEYNGGPPMTLVEYYDIRHAASTLSSLQEMHSNKRICCQASFYLKNTLTGTNTWKQQQQSQPSIDFKMARTNSTPGDIMYSISCPNSQDNEFSWDVDLQTTSQYRGLFRPLAQQVLKFLPTEDNNEQGLSHSICDVTEGIVEEDFQHFRQSNDAIHSQKRLVVEHPISAPSNAHNNSMNSNISNVQKDINVTPAPNDKRTTFMIRNIPNKYTQPMLLECINETHFGKFDFLYLRMDFKNKCNVGYAFINFINTEVIASFIQQHVGKKWGRFNSDKICSLSYATIQGRRALIEKFRNSSVMDEEPSYRPKIFYISGPNIGQEEPFPGPTISKDGFRGHHGVSRRRISTAPQLHHDI